MAVRNIRLFGDPVLNSRADPVTRFDAGLRAMVQDMLETMDHAGGVGLAANQIGRTARVFVFDCSGLRGHIINPVWEPLYDEQILGAEGCLSVPGIRGKIQRYSAVRATGRDTEGRPLVVQASGLLARCIQHETDHLDGVMFMRRMDPEAGKEAMAVIRGSNWYNEDGKEK